MSATPPPSEAEPDGRIENLTHDLLNAVAFVKGQAQLLQRRIRRVDDADLAMLDDRLGRIDRSANRMAELIADVRRETSAQPERVDPRDRGTDSAA
jgi:signal transduction histidine kinase